MDADVSTRWKSTLFLVFVSGLLFFFNLGVPGLWDEDEPRNATCAREMLERSDLIVPTFNGELRTAKPVLLYWLIISAYSLFGVNEFSARFWSALLATGTVLLTSHLGRKLYSPRVGLWSGLLLASGLMFVVAARACTPDSVLVFFITAALTLIATTWAERRNSPLGLSSPPAFDAAPRLSTFTAVLFYSAIGFAILGKGPVGIVLPVAILGCYLLVSTMGRDISHNRSLIFAIRSSLFSPGWYIRQFKSLRIEIGIPLLCLIVAPWYIAVAWQTEGAWVNQFLGAENVGRFLKPMEGHRGPIFYYLIAILIGFYPASVFLPYSLILLAKRLRTTALASDLFLACWSLVWIGFFSLAGTKLPSYVTPAYPALAALTARGIVSWIEQPQLIPRWLTRVAMGIPILVGIGYTGAIPFVAAKFLSADARLLWVAVIPLASGIAASVYLHQWRTRAAAISFMTGGVAFSVALFALVSVQVDRFQSSEPLFTEMKTKYPDLHEIGIFRFSPPSLVYYAGHPIEVLRSTDQVADFISRQHSSGCLIVRAHELPEIRRQLPADWSVLTRRRYFLKDEEILVVGGPSTPVRSASNRPVKLEPAKLEPVTISD